MSSGTEERRQMWARLAAAEVFGVPSLRNQLSCGLAGQVHGGERQRAPFLQYLSCDQHVLAQLGRVHVAARKKNRLLLRGRNKQQS